MIARDAGIGIIMGSASARHGAQPLAAMLLDPGWRYGVAE